MSLTNVQKAAALVVAVGPSAASQILEYLDEDEVQALAAEVARLEQVDDDVLESVMREVHQETEARQNAAGGIDYVNRLLRNWKGGRGSQIVDSIRSEIDTAPFRFVPSFEPVAVTKALEHEHPQVLALVVAHQPPSAAARLLSSLDPALRADIAMRVATMGSVMPDVMGIVEEALKERLDSRPSGGKQGGGARGLAKVLKSSDRDTEKAILEGLSLHDPDLAEQVKDLMFVFDDIAGLDDRAIQRILSDVDTETLAKALKGGQADTKDKVLENMSQRARDRLLEELDLMTSIAKKDVTEAQKVVAATVRRLADADEIQIKAEDRV